MTPSPDTGDLVIHRDPPSDYASVKYAVAIFALASLFVATAATGILNHSTAGTGDQATQAKSETPAPAANANDKAGEAPPAEAAANNPPEEPPAAATGASSGEAGATPPQSPAPPSANEAAPVAAPASEQQPEAAPPQPQPQQ